MKNMLVYCSFGKVVIQGIPVYWILHNLYTKKKYFQDPNYWTFFDVLTHKSLMQRFVDFRGFCASSSGKAFKN